MIVNSVPRVISLTRGAIAALLVAAPLGAQAPASTPAPKIAPTSYVIRNATIVPVVGARITGGSVVIKDGKIAAVGASVSAPADATVVDGSGLFVYPGLIDSGTKLGLSEIESVPGGQDVQELGDFNPHDVALSAVNPHSEVLGTVRTSGITTVITGQEGSLISGQASLMDLAGWTPAQMGIAPRAGLIVVYPRVARRRGRGGAQQSDAERRDAMNKQVQQLSQYFSDARAYADIRGKLAAGAKGELETNLPFEAMIPVIRGKEPVIFDVETASQIRGALALADTFHLKPILRGAGEAWMLADELASKKIPVIVGPTTETPSDTDDPYDMVYANPGVLAKAGVMIAFQTNAAADSRNLPYNAALAEAYGLDADAALKAVTINPAQIWGVGDRYGSIEVGKVANLIVTTGDPLDVRSTVKHLFIRGEEISLMDRHAKLYEEFKNRPKP